MKTRMFLIAFCSIIAFSTIFYGQTKATASPTVPAPPAQTTPDVFNGLSKDHIQDLEGFGFLLSQYVKVTGRAADLEPLWEIPTQNILSCHEGDGIKIWPKSEDGEKWRGFLKLQNLPEPETNKHIPNQTILCLADDKRSFFSVDVDKSSSDAPTVGSLFIIFSRGFYSTEMVFIQHNILEPIASQEIDLFESWKTDADINKADWKSAPKNKKIELELIGRLILMARAFYRLDFAFQEKNFTELEYCSLGHIDRKNAPECAEFIWNYEFESLKKLSEESLNIMTDKKSGLPTLYLYPPAILDEFSRLKKDDGVPDVNATFDIVFKNYLKEVLPKWYPDQMKLLGPFWEKK